MMREAGYVACKRVGRSAYMVLVRNLNIKIPTGGLSIWDPCYIGT
jgi:hypothetical protein